MWFSPNLCKFTIQFAGPGSLIKNDVPSSPFHNTDENFVLANEIRPVTSHWVSEQVSLEC